MHAQGDSTSFLGQIHSWTRNKYDCHEKRTRDITCLVRGHTSGLVYLTRKLSGSFRRAFSVGDRISLRPIFPLEIMTLAVLGCAPPSIPPSSVHEICACWRQLIRLAENMRNACNICLTNSTRGSSRARARTQRNEKAPMYCFVAVAF